MLYLFCSSQRVRRYLGPLAWRGPRVGSAAEDNLSLGTGRSETAQPEQPPECRRTIILRVWTFLLLQGGKRKDEKFSSRLECISLEWYIRPFHWCRPVSTTSKYLPYYTFEKYFTWMIMVITLVWDTWLSRYRDNAETLKAAPKEFSIFLCRYDILMMLYFLNCTLTTSFYTDRVWTG